VNYPVGYDYLATDTQFTYDAAGNRSSVIDGSGTSTYTTNSLNQYTAAGSASYEYDDSGNMTHDPNFLYTYDPENRLTKLHRSGQTPGPGGALAEAVDSGLSYTTGGDTPWQPTNWPYHYGGDAAEGTAWNDGASWLQTEVEGAGTLKFWWKVSSEANSDYLEFYIDTVLQNYPISGEQDWAEKTYTINTSGTHTLKWRYAKNSSGSEGDDRGWVDYVQWSGQAPQPENWTEVEYVYDPSGRRGVCRRHVDHLVRRQPRQSGCGHGLDLLPRHGGHLVGPRDLAPGPAGLTSAGSHCLAICEVCSCDPDSSSDRMPIRPCACTHRLPVSANNAARNRAARPARDAPIPNAQLGPMVVQNTPNSRLPGNAARPIAPL
jgi:YD repeat-containing protein